MPYDKNGNRTRRISGDVEELYQYDPRNRLTSYTKGDITTPFRYDNAGNLLSDDKAFYAYDDFNRTIKVETFDGKVQINRYDAEGLRYEMEENGNLVQFIFNLDREVVSEEDASGLNRLIRGTELIARSCDSARTYYHYASDEMGSTTHIVDEDGAVQNRYEYDAWGNITFQEETIPNRFKFTGQQLDPVTQQYYLRARFYNPIIARFTQEDTYRGDGLNLYAYCENNPVFYVDPSGHQPQCVKDAAARYIAEGMSKEDAYKRAYAEHAQWKLDDPNLSPRERYKLEQRQRRINQPNTPTTPTLSPGMDYAQARKAGLTASQAFALSTKNNPLVKPVGGGKYTTVHGHHVLQAVAFDSAPNYSHSKAFAISDDRLAEMGLTHIGTASITSQQKSLQKELRNSGKPNTMNAQAEVAYNAIVNANKDPARLNEVRTFAHNIVTYAITDMYAQGVVAPTGIPKR